MANGARSFLIKFIGDSKHLQGETDAVTGRLGKIKAAVGEADGVFGKLKAGGGAALQGVGGAGAVAAAGVAAAAAAAAKGLMDFQNLGLEVGKGAEATGLSAEAFSRWKEVAADAGIEQAGLEGTIGKFNKTLGATPGVVAGFGVEIVKAKDGTTDVNETFLNAIDTLNAIKDPAERAEAGAKLFGRSWQGMAEIISRGSGQLRTDLAAVSDAKVFDDSKVEDARKLRDAFDQIKDAGEDLFLVIGETLAPVVADLAPMLADAVEQVKPLAKGFGDLISGALNLVGPLLKLSNALLGPVADALGKVMTVAGDLVGGLGDMVDAALGGGTELEGVAEQVNKLVTAQSDAATEADELAESLEAEQEAAAKAREEQRRLTEKVEDGYDALREYRGELDELTGALGNEQAWLNLQQNIDDTVSSIYASQLQFDEGTISAEENSRKQQLAWIDLKQQVNQYGTDLGLLPNDITTLLNLIDNNQIEDMERRLAILARNRQMNLSIEVNGGVGYTVRVDPVTGGIPHKARGGRIEAGRPVVVGDNLDGSWNDTTEIIVPDGAGTVLSNRDARSVARSSGSSGDGDGGGLHVHVTVQGDVVGIEAFDRVAETAFRRLLTETDRSKRGNQ